MGHSYLIRSTPLLHILRWTVRKSRRKSRHTVSLHIRIPLLMMADSRQQLITLGKRHIRFMHHPSVEEIELNWKMHGNGPIEAVPTIDHLSPLVLCYILNIYWSQLTNKPACIWNVLETGAPRRNPTQSRWRSDHVAVLQLCSIRALTQLLSALPWPSWQCCAVHTIFRNLNN